MFTTRKLIQSVLVAATIAVTAPAHADASFATGGYERFEPALSAPGSAVPAASEASFANGGYARFARERKARSRSRRTASGRVRHSLPPAVTHATCRATPRRRTR